MQLHLLAQLCQAPTKLLNSNFNAIKDSKLFRLNVDRTLMLAEPFSVSHGNSSAKSFHCSRISWTFCNISEISRLPVQALQQNENVLAKLFMAFPVLNFTHSSIEGALEKDCYHGGSTERKNDRKYISLWLLLCQAANKFEFHWKLNCLWPSQS